LEPDPFSCCVSLVVFQNHSEILMLYSSIILLVLSGLISGVENAFFSISKSDILSYKLNKNLVVISTLRLLDNPEKLLSTLFIINTVINVSYILISSLIINQLVVFSYTQAINILIHGFIIVFLLLVFGEILPKILASKFRMFYIYIMVFPIKFLSFIFAPLTSIMVKSSSLISKKIARRQVINISELSEAINLVSDDLDDDEKILKGIVKFRNIFVKEIMQPRIDVVCIDIKAPLTKVISVILESGFSRIPVISGNFDNISGILYVKDLLPHFNIANFNWQSIIRPPYYVPESKRINDLLSEFQNKKIHMAIVVDEYGGSSGIVTLEDILEEIVGDITDEFDPEDNDYYKIDDYTWVFEGKTQIMDFYKVFEIDEDIFENIKGDSDTLAGVMLEVLGQIPAKNEKIQITPFTFTIKSVDNRRIKQIYVKRDN